ncbi:MAG: IS110 family transposase [Solirubrobacterales bacterium]
MRAIGLDVHRDFCEVAIAEAGELRSAGSIETTPESLELLAGSLATDDLVALESTGNATEIARIIRPHVGRVVVVSATDTGIRQARAKTDRLDARTLARLAATGSLDAVWTPDERSAAMRRRLARRSQLVRARTRAKNEVHAVLVRRLKGRPPVSDLFGPKGRRWLATLELPAEEEETVAGCLRHVDFLGGEIDALDAQIADAALGWAEVRRLMSVPGVSVVTAATFMAAIGEISRFPGPRQLVAYLGLDPRVRQSGSTPAAHGRISKQGSAPVRHVLVEAAWTAVRAPGPLRVFYQRLRARRGHQVAIVATARKLACLFWHLLTRGEDYAYGQPSLTRKKLRRLELAAGAKPRQGQRRHPGGAHNLDIRAAERELAWQAEVAYRRMIADWRASGPPAQKEDASVTSGHASDRPSKGKAARQTPSP